MKVNKLCHAQCVFIVHAVITSFPTPRNISWDVVHIERGRDILVLRWSSTAPEANCLANVTVAYHNIFHSNCGLCPSMTLYQNVTCILSQSIAREDRMYACTIAVQAVAFENTTSNWSKALHIQIGLVYTCVLKMFLICVLTFPKQSLKTVLR